MTPKTRFLTRLALAALVAAVAGTTTHLAKGRALDASAVVYWDSDPRLNPAAQVVGTEFAGCGGRYRSSGVASPWWTAKTWSCGDEVRGTGPTLCYDQTFYIVPCPTDTFLQTPTCTMDPNQPGCINQGWGP